MNVWKINIEIVCEGNPQYWIYQAIQEQLNKNEQIKEYSVSKIQELANGN